MISVLLPTRGRPDQLRTSVYSLLDNATHPQNVSILIRIDDDDRYFEIPIMCYVIFGPRHGYRNLHLYYNELAAKAYGDWLMLWNDDAVMQESGWDEQIESVQAGLRVTGHFLFPAISRDLYQAMGHFSRQAHCDSYVEAVGRGLDCLQFLPLKISHERVSTPECVTETSAEFFGAACQEWIQEDIKRIRSAHELKAVSVG